MNRRNFIILLASFYFTTFLKAAQKPLPKQFEMKLSSFKVNGIAAEEAFKLLSDQVKQEDPEKKGLMILFNAKKSKNISMNISAMPVLQIINYLCLSGNYRYKITGRTVNIFDK